MEKRKWVLFGALSSGIMNWAKKYQMEERKEKKNKEKP